LFDLRDDLLVVGVTERGVLAGGDNLVAFLPEATTDVLQRHAFAEQIFQQDQVRRLRIDVIRADQVELLLPFREHVVDRGRRLLVHGLGGVEDVRRHLLALVLHRVEEQALLLLENGKDGFAADRCPATEGYSDLVDLEQRLRLLSEQRPVRGTVDHDRLDLLAQHTTGLVDLVERVEQNVAERSLADRHRAAEGMENADLDGILRARGSGAKEGGEARKREQSLESGSFHEWEGMGW